MRHTIIIKILAFVTLIIVGICFLTILNRYENENKIKIAIYPTGTGQETYYFEINDKGILKCSIGTKKNNNFKRNKILREIKNTAEIKLTNLELQTFMNLINQLQNSGFNDRKKIVSDSWDVALVYKNKQYEMNYRINNSEVFKELIDKIITLSPLPVDLHGWS